MTVTEFATWLWAKRWWGFWLVIAAIFGPPAFDEYSKKTLAANLEVEREGVNTSASLAGMMLVSAWRSCTQIGIQDVDACSKYEGKLLQELGAPILAKTAANHRDGYYASCSKFYSTSYCNQLLTRSVNLSAAQRQTSD